jgi:hypothetical protein
MWIKKINEFFDNMSEYDNNSLALHFAVDLIDMLKERVTFTVDDECNVSIVILPFEDMKEDTEVDEEGFLNWLQFTFHHELIDIILSLKNKFEGMQQNLKKILHDSKVEGDPQKQANMKTDITTTEKELETLKMILSRVDTYRRNTFGFLRDKDSIVKLITHIRIYKEQNSI